MITVRNLIQQYRAYNPDGHFFDRDVIKRYGENIATMRINGKGIVETRDGDVHICYELECMQRLPGFGSRLKRYYFDIDNYAVIIPGMDDTATAWTHDHEYLEVI